MVTEAVDTIQTYASEGDLCGCALALVATAYGRAATYTLSLNRDPHTYTRTLTAEELAALARLVQPGTLRGIAELLAELLAVLRVLTGREDFGMFWYGPLAVLAVALRVQIAEVGR